MLMFASRVTQVLVQAPAAATPMPPAPVLAVANPAAWVLASLLCTTTASAVAKQLPGPMGIRRGR
jgi:hypothetical protein